MTSLQGMAKWTLHLMQYCTPCNVMCVEKLVMQKTSNDIIAGNGKMDIAPHAMEPVWRNW